MLRFLLFILNCICSIAISCANTGKNSNSTSDKDSFELSDEEKTLISLRDQLDSFFANLNSLSSEFIQNTSGYGNTKNTVNGEIMLKRGEHNKVKVHFISGKIADMLLIDNTLTIVNRKNNKKKKYALSSPLLSLLVGNLTVKQLNCIVDISDPLSVTFTLSHSNDHRVQLNFKRHKKTLGQWQGWKILQKQSQVEVNFQNLQINLQAIVDESVFELK